MAPWPTDSHGSKTSLAFVAIMPEGTAKVWWKDRDVTPPAWCYRIEVGETIAQGHEDTKQAAADRATNLWPDTVAKEQARMSKIEAQRHLEHRHRGSAPTPAGSMSWLLALDHRTMVD